MRTRILIVVAALVLALAAIVPVAAVTGGQPDGVDTEMAVDRFVGDRRPPSRSWRHATLSRSACRTISSAIRAFASSREAAR